MDADLSEILGDWPYDPGKVNVRLIRSAEGEPLIQIRLDLGILQLRYDGRPDGKTVNGYPSLLEYFEARLDGIEPEDDEAEAGDADAPADSDARSRPRSSGGATSAGQGAGGFAEANQDEDDGGTLDADDEGEAAPLQLTPEDCRALRDEAAQYYHRYVAMLILEDFEGVVRDTSRNLRVIDLCARFATDDEDRATLEEFRPYIMMMRARALASQALRDNEAKAAIVAVDEGLDALRQYHSDRGDPESFAESNEAQALREMREALVPKLPVSQSAELRQRLKRALEQENYELAAILRDELRLVTEKSTPHA
ncbi:MAG: UvrB/UvrC motif-containing protein [Phycisphaerales bacterium]